MKTKICINLFFLLFCCIGVTMAQHEELSYIPIMEQANDYLERIERQGFIVDRIEFDLIQEDRTRRSNFLFYAGEDMDKEYVLVAFGEEGRIADIDLNIYREADDPKPLFSGSSPGNEEKIWFAPDETAYYVLEVSGFQYIPPWDIGRYCLIIYRKSN